MQISNEDFEDGKRRQFSSFTKAVFWVALAHLVALALMALLLL